MVDFPLPVDEFGVPIAIGIEIDDYEIGLSEVWEWISGLDGEQAFLWRILREYIQKSPSEA